MIPLETQFINDYLKSEGYITRVGLVYPGNDNSILAIKVDNGIVIDKVHLEQKILFSKSSYLTFSEEVEHDAYKQISQMTSNYVIRTFTDHRAMALKDNAVGESKDIKWRYIMVTGEIRSQYEADCLQNLGIELLNFKAIVDQLKKIDRRWKISHKTWHDLRLLNYLK